MKKTCRHIAIIMDGNGRWATSKGLNRSQGHQAGATNVRDITIGCSDLGLSHLTLYAFSTENWKRPTLEVEILMKLLEQFLKAELPLFMENNIRFETIGDLSIFSKRLQKQFEITKSTTASNTGMTQVLAVNYGSHDEIARAANAVLESGDIITPKSISNHLDSRGHPEVDMLIRTGGDYRLSNFLLWQSAYAELFFTPTLWPDFGIEELKGMIGEFENRERRFGGV
jgi:undecaprenyl diphosphate synthase